MTSLSVLAATAKTALGDEARAAAAGRAGLSGFRAHPSHLARPPVLATAMAEPLVVASTDVDPEVGASERLVRLALPALSALVARAGLQRRTLASLALYVVVPADDAVTERWDLDTFGDRLCARGGIAPARVEVHRGRCATFELLPRATAWLEHGEHAVVLAVDTWLDPERLEWLDAEGRAKSARNVDGFVPGEAAAAVLLGRADQRQGSVTIVAHHVAQEPNTATSGLRSTGVGSSAALQHVWSGAPHPARWVLSDFNGESYRAAEWGLVTSRCAPWLSIERAVFPVEALGDVGAATGAVLLAMADQAVARGYAHPDVLVLCADDAHRRAALRATVHRRGD